MKNKLTKSTRWLGNGIGAILTYIFLMIDRLILVPFQWVSSYSAQELQTKPDRHSTVAMIRVSAAIIITALIFLFKIIF